MQGVGRINVLICSVQQEKHQNVFTDIVLVPLLFIWRFIRRHGIYSVIFFVNTEETSVITFYTFLDNIFEIFANREHRKTIVFTHVQTFIYFFDVHA